MKRETVETDTWRTDDMHVVCPRAAGLDVHKMCIIAAVRVCEAGGGPARTAVREFSALPDGLRAMTEWLREHGVTAATMEGTAAPCRVIERGYPHEPSDRDLPPDSNGPPDTSAIARHVLRIPAREERFTTK